MSKHLRAILLSISLLYNVAAFSQAPDEASRDTAGSEPRQLILIIGDGMDDQQITIARNYLVGAQGQLSLDQLPLRSTSQILTIEDKINGKPVYVADSANTASSMATGVITSRGRISTTAGSDRDAPTIVELAEAAGYRTGIVTTSTVTDATPAAFAAHINFRLCENPELMRDVTMSGIQLGNCKNDLKVNGGKGSISEQLASSGLDVILGGGNKHFSQTAEGDDRSVLQLAEDNGFQVVGTAAELGLANYDRRLLGLFSAGHLPVRLQGEGGRAAEAPEPSILNQLHDYLGDISLPEPMRCEPNPKFSEAPSLKQMTEAALAHLSEGNERGFFLMIESASIDKQAHKRQPCGSIGELEQLEEALRSALAFAASHPRTLILVTADHAQAAQIIPYESLFASYPIPISTPGKIARIITPEGSHMAINYATSTFMAEEHTGANVPLFGNAESLGLVPPFVRQPQLFEISRDYLGL